MRVSDEERVELVLYYLKSYLFLSLTCYKVFHYPLLSQQIVFSISVPLKLNSRRVSDEES